MEPSSWICPYCNRIATITNSDVTHSEHPFLRVFRDDAYVLLTTVIVCPNSKCQEYTITAALQKGIKRHKRNIAEGNVFPDGSVGPILSWKIKPQSHAKQFPNYVPKPIVEDYEEACSIKNFSPKASAALARRCLQGMIRDFWGIKKATLFAEINAIQEKVDSQTWQAIDAVRSIGNIGAHMEKDINLIIDVEPDEAEVLIRLIETLIKEWYITRHDRQTNLASVIEIAGKKQKQRKGEE